VNDETDTTVSIWHLAQRDELVASARALHVFTAGDRRHCIAATRSGLWVISQRADAARVAFRVAFSPGELGIESLTVAADGTSVDVVVASTIGAQTATISVDVAHSTVSASTTLTPAEPLVMKGWPRDVVADLDGGGGTVHTSQRGLRTGLVHANAPGSGAFMYLQDLTLLGGYCDVTHASAKGTVSGEWPDLGFALPVGSAPLPAGQPVRISTWHVAFADDACETPVDVARQYLQLLATLFMNIERPTPEYVDWRRRAEQCRLDLDRCDECWSTISGKRYLRAYVGDDKHPPESMVQLAVLLPLVERSKWCGASDPIAEALAASLGRFQDDRVGAIGRWLPEVENMLDGTEPHEHPRLMDSWYVFHPLLNLARLALESGDDRAREQFLDSLDYVIDVAHHFDYDWPVFYDVDSLDVIKAESEPGKGGEHDVPGIYAHVMIQAFDVTKESRYLDEAVAAIRSMHDKGFELAYQTNTVAYGMVAALRLHEHTGDQEMLDISHVLAACLFDNVGLWSTRYGHARNRASFFGIFPMPTAPYTAAYEQAEVAAACLDYIERAGPDLAPPLAVLMPEFIRHVTARLDTYYPPCIPEEALAESPKTGHLMKDLWIPVEDIADGWDEAGTVGQQVYGAGIAFSTVVRSYVRVPKSTAMVYCEYPFSLIDVDEQRVVVHVYGDSRLRPRVRVLADDRPTPIATVTGSSTGQIECAAEGDGWNDYWVPAGQDVTIEFG